MPIIISKLDFLPNNRKIRTGCDHIAILPFESFTSAISGYITNFNLLVVLNGFYAGFAYSVLHIAFNVFTHIFVDFANSSLRTGMSRLVINFHNTLFVMLTGMPSGSSIADFDLSA